MRIDFLKDPALAERYVAVHAETGEEIEGLAWGDSSTGVFATFKRRPRTMTDAANADLRIKSQDGNWALQIHTGEIEFVDRTVNPLKAELLALLDDQDVAAKIKDLVWTRDAG